MGIDIEWKIIQGATEKEWQEALNGDEVFQEREDSTASFLMDHLGMECVSPHYDADSDYCIYGIEIAAGDGITEVDLSALADKAIGANQYLREEFGLISSTVISQHVW